jgi:hypothetical protein
MKKPIEFGIFVNTRRGPRGAACVNLDACAIVATFDLPGVPGAPAGRYAVILTSRPAYAGARRRQIVPAGQVLNLSRVGSAGFSRRKLTVAKPSGASFFRSTNE